MDLAISMLFSWQFVLFCLGIAAITYICRTIVEYFLGVYNKKDSKLWTELFLPIGPPITGSIVAHLFKSYPYPQEINSIGGVIIFGLVAGLFSGLVYKIVKGLLTKNQDNIGKEAEDVVSKLRDTIVK